MVNVYIQTCCLQPMHINVQVSHTTFSWIKNLAQQIVPTTFINTHTHAGLTHLWLYSMPFFLPLFLHIDHIPTSLSHLSKHMLDWWGGTSRPLAAHCSLSLPQRKCLWPACTLWSSWALCWNAKVLLCQRSRVLALFYSDWLLRGLGRGVGPRFAATCTEWVASF